MTTPAEQDDAGETWRRKMRKVLEKRTMLEENDHVRGRRIIQPNEEDEASGRRHHRTKQGKMTTPENMATYEKEEYAEGRGLRNMNTQKKEDKRKG